MEALFRSVLRLYPANVRDVMGEEILDVFREGRVACAGRGGIVQFRFCSRELSGILGGVVREHARNLLPSFDNFVPIGRCFMRSGMKFPIAGVVFMVLSFLGVMYAIFEAQAVSAAAPKDNPALILQPVHVNPPGGIVILIAIAYVLGIVGWVVVHSLRRSGVERLSQTETWTAAK
jgi:hypothetical protein